ncbi:MAG: hypothetical protein M0007_05160 [Actinomycetota bacterium]|nr:hypothetical protein [Actinomycetota bacterium]
MIPPPDVTVETGGAASGMAMMVAELLRANLADSRFRARLARRARGSVVLMASDRGLGVTVGFAETGITVVGEPTSPAPTLAGGWLEMAAVCSGSRSPLRALARRELRVTVGRPVRLLASAGYMLKVPRSVASGDH